MPSIDTLIPDIYALFEADRIDVNEDFITQYSEAITSLTRVRLGDVRRSPYLRLSNLGKPDRQLWYDINYKGEKEELKGPQHIKFAYGDIIEHMILFLARQAGHTVEHEQEEFEIDGVKGHIDAVIDGVLVDVKSASTFSFQKFVKGTLFEEGEDPFGYVTQLASYLQACQKKYPLIRDAAFLPIDKTLGKLWLTRVPNAILSSFNASRRVSDARSMLDFPQPPARCYDPKADGVFGNLVLDTGCTYCQHRGHCWGDSNGGRGLRIFLYSNGPRYFTRVVKEPKVQEITPGASF